MEASISFPEYEPEDTTADEASQTILYMVEPTDDAEAEDDGQDQATGIKAWEFDDPEELSVAGDADEEAEIFATQVAISALSKGREKITWKDHTPTSTLQIFRRDVIKHSLLTKDEEVALAKRIERGDIEAKQMMVVSNIRLAMKIAASYKYQGLDYEELIQEGTFGLIKAADKFDYRRGYKFSTYATWWIKENIVRAIADKGRAIRLPVHRVELLNKAIRTSRRLTQELGHEPSSEDIAAELDERHVTPELIAELMRMGQKLASLDSPVGKEGDNELIDIIENSESRLPEDEVIESILAQSIESALKKLPEKERRVIEMRYGLNGSAVGTLAAVGKHMGLTVERVRQLQKQAEKRLGTFKGIQDMEDILD